MIRRFYVRRDQLKEDGWTYGDWRQYVAWHDDDSPSIVRLSSAPIRFAIVGFVAIATALPAIMVGLERPEAVDLTRTMALAVLGLMLLCPLLVQIMTPWRLVVVVGGVRRKDGGWERDL